MLRLLYVQSLPPMQQRNLIDYHAVVVTMRWLLFFFQALVLATIIAVAAVYNLVFEADNHANHDLDAPTMLVAIKAESYEKNVINGSQVTSISNSFVVGSTIVRNRTKSSNKAQDKNNKDSSAYGVAKRSLKFFLAAPPDYTSMLLTNYPEKASKYYHNHLNEESAEIWLHRGFERMTLEQGQTHDSKEADVILVSGLLHLNLAIEKQEQHGKRKRKRKLDRTKLLHVYEEHLLQNHTLHSTRDKPHLLLVPTWNPSVASEIGIKDLVKMLHSRGLSNLWSVGFERNEMWQGVPVGRILPIPYVVRPREENNDTLPRSEVPATQNRTRNFVFFAGDIRKDAKGWAGCHRDRLILPLRNASNTDVRLVTKTNRLNQSEYNHRMRTSEYCLIVCGDTPSSRSLTSAMVSGCIPIRVGSRLRGFCETPCHRGFGWKPSGPEHPHLPFPETIPWEIFPELDEQEFMESGQESLHRLFEAVGTELKAKIRTTLQQVQGGWIFGWGDPTNSTHFGDAVSYIWRSYQQTLS